MSSRISSIIVSSKICFAMSPSISATTPVLSNWQRFIGFSNIRAHRRIFLQGFSHHLAWFINLKRLFNVSPSCFHDCSGISTISCSFLSFDSWKQQIERWLWCRRDDPNNGEDRQITRAIQERLLPIYWLRILSPSAHWPNSRTATKNATTDDQRQQAAPLIVVVSADFVERHISRILLHPISLLRARLFSIRSLSLWTRRMISFRHYSRKTVYWRKTEKVLSFQISATLTMEKNENDIAEKIITAENDVRQHSLLVRRRLTGYYWR